MTLELITKQPRDPHMIAAKEVKEGLEHLFKNLDVIICQQSIGSDFSITLQENENLSSKKHNDRYYICIKEGSGYIEGANEVSTLIASYAFLQELGFRYPSPIATYKPEPVSDSFKSVSIIKQSEASYKHRGIVLEGGNRLENVIDMIKWMPKMGMNSFFIQFKVPYIFFSAWYTHMNNNLFQPEQFDKMRSIRMGHTIEEALKERGMHIHAVGHGWSCEAVGLDGFGWEKVPEKIAKPIRNRLAMINGKRCLYHGIPINTNLCYAQQENIDAMVNQIVKFAKEHENIDILHVWLADENNNICECEQCKKTIPADQYIKILNIVDAELTKQNLNTKICMLIYNDLLSAPQKERINNKSRFLLMFAPIARTFESGFKDIKNIEEPKPYSRNKNILPVKIEENIAYLKAWKKVFTGDSFDFDYHLGRAHYGDPGYMKISKIISNDIKELENLGLNGLMSCQEIRCAFPTFLPNYTMAKTLWNKDIEFTDVVNEYFIAEYGCLGIELSRILTLISNCFNMDFWNGKFNGIQPKIAQKLGNVSELSPELLAIANKALSDKLITKNQGDSWRRIVLLASFVKLFGTLLQRKAERNSTTEEYIAFESFLKNHEVELQPTLDVYRIIRVSKEYLHLNK